MGVANVVSENRFGDSQPDEADSLIDTLPKPSAKPKKNSMDGSEMRKLHGTLMQWYRTERDKQAENRRQMAIDEDFYDGMQWTEEDAQELMERGQAPIVFNKIKPTINWLLGTERRTRVDGKVLGRSEDDEEAAEVKSKLLKYVSDVNKTPWSQSLAFADCVKAGVGWLEDGISSDPEDELLMSGMVRWRDILHDSTSREMDINKDGRYIFRQRYIDLDYALELCPDRKAAIQQAATKGDELVNESDDDVWHLGQRVSGTDEDYQGSRSGRYNYSGVSSVGSENNRPRVKIIEAWYKVPERCDMCRGGMYDGQKYDAKHAGMRDEVEQGNAVLASHVRMQMRVALMTEQAMLYEGPSPYKHNRFPFTPIWCYRRSRDGLPYGAIRDIRSPQEDYNKRASKALHILASRQIIADHGAVDDIEELRQEAARPDAIIFKKKGYELNIEQDKQLAQQHLDLMDRDGQMILDVGGVTEQNLGQDSNSLSGKAIGKLQDQGGIVTTLIFDNLRFAIQCSQEKRLSLIEQYYTAERVVRIVGEAKPVEWLPINRYDPETGQFINDITARQADFIIDEMDFKASTRQAMFETMMELLPKLPPEVALSLLDMVIDFADVPNKSEIVARIRKINGQRDPNRKPTPEEQAAMDENEARNKRQQQIAEDTAIATLKKIQAEAARAEGAATQARNAAMEIAVKAAYEALQGAQIVGTVPGITPVADAILAGAGYVDNHGTDPNIPEAANPQPVVPADLQAQQAMQQAGATAPPPDLQQADGMDQGIETPQNDQQPQLQ